MKCQNRYLAVFQALIPLYGGGIRFRLYLRLREYFRKRRYTFMATCLKSYLHKRYGCELSINAEISPKCEFMHTSGVIIGEGCIVSPGVKFYGNITLGRKNVFNENDYPHICEDAVLGTGCTILGKVIIGKGAVIGANSTVVKDVEPYSVYVGNPAKRIK